MGIYVLCFTAMFTLLLNLYLVYRILSAKNIDDSSEFKNMKVVNFTLKPTAQDEALDTEILATEIIVRGELDGGAAIYKTPK